ncbi:hypothetical protein RI367_002121 [Sorochytrium milnesiophthora]
MAHQRNGWLDLQLLGSPPFGSTSFHKFLETVDCTLPNLSFLLRLRDFTDCFNASSDSPEDVERLHSYALSILAAFVLPHIPSHSELLVSSSPITTTATAATNNDQQQQPKGQDQEQPVKQSNNPTLLPLLRKPPVKYRNFVVLGIDQDSTLPLAAHAAAQTLIAHFLPSQTSSAAKLSSDVVDRSHLHPSHFAALALVVLTYMHHATMPRYHRFRAKNLTKTGRCINYALSVALLSVTAVILWWTHSEEYQRLTRLFTVLPLWAAGVCWIQAARSFSIFQYLVDSDVVVAPIANTKAGDADGAAAASDTDVADIRYWMCWRILGWSFACSCIAVGLVVSFVPA